MQAFACSTFCACAGSVCWCCVAQVTHHVQHDSRHMQCSSPPVSKGQLQRHKLRIVHAVGHPVQCRKNHWYGAQSNGSCSHQDNDRIISGKCWHVAGIS